MGSSPTSRINYFLFKKDTMIKVHCHTNLDLCGELWPTELPCRPMVGDYIESATIRSGGFRLTLQVTRVTLTQNSVDVELHMTNMHKSLYPRDKSAAVGSITAFYEWYAPKVGKSVGYFI